MEKRWESTDQVVEEIMRIHRSLPPRPGIDEVEAARDLIQNVDKEDQARLEAIAKLTKSSEVPEELFMVLQEMKKAFVYFQSKEQKMEALKLLDLESIHTLFDDLIQRASSCVSSPPSSNGSAPAPAPARPPPVTPSPAPAFSSGSPTSLNFSEKGPVKSKELFTRDDSYVAKAKSSIYGDGIVTSRQPRILDSTLQPGIASGQDGDKLSLIKLASLIEASAKKGTQDLNLQNKLMDQVEWLPDSIGKLSGLVTLDLSENRILVLPNTIGGLSSLTKLDLHSNRISQLPDSIGNLLNLVHLNLSGNHLSSLPSVLSRLVRLEELDLSSNSLSVLPESIGSLVNLKKLDIETNDIEEIPHTIGECSSLKELRADYNKLKALPEAVGKITTLEVLSVRYNNVRQLPTTMSSLANLKELDVSFNELESVPESLCFATTLVKLNIGNNFADMRSLPRSIGNLENLEVLDISNNQIRFLPDSFRMLTRLRVLRAEENPLEVPPRDIAEKGAQAVVQYMTDLVEKRNTKTQTVKQKKSWVQMCFFSKSNKRKRNGMEFV
ncbi:PREDICTED: plant intracellular Ras-group-related LRR protein 4-like [Tarenaya hassleriana]|uniref:plant intracellular Ras-group-related LRR protein 4-like n=1 Tax=Tarenaya hassleriana TaxID=28532 RepID=UPI00053C8DB4|nr:PREDICTED: plant intracellular Ras-group-related LRR protein 4-like [Tarenaya hassleriana]XP_010530984.1 PREDICTED: plant intracellular Ras-group-related LRR protein 4-like [Tarenaya hassleriana]XP_019057426.1 PREDICTED: plant intracellular Ras-group-related LRR protein 4-like [Tarenaya hassleriana]